jgi:hypothetical protein
MAAHVVAVAMAVAAAVEQQDHQEAAAGNLSETYK